jgi:hypothetical protein
MLQFLSQVAGMLVTSKGRETTHMAKQTKSETVDVEYDEKPESTALTAPHTGDEGIIHPNDVGDMERLFDEGFQTERTFKVGDPELNGVPVYFGELVGPGADIETKTPDGKPGLLHTWLWHPVNVKTLKANQRILDTIISGHQMHAKSMKLHAMAKEQGGKGQALVRWVGVMRIHGGKQTLNEVEFTPRVVKA